MFVCLAAWPALAQEGGEVWSQFQGGPGHPGSAEGPAPPYRQRWRFVAPSGSVSGAVLTRDLAIAVGQDAVYAIDLATGDVAWDIPRDGGPLSYPALGVVDGRSALLYLDGPAPQDGASSGPTPSGSAAGSPSGSPSSSPSGSGSPEARRSELVAVDLEDRSELWRTTLEHQSRSGVTLDGERAYVADDHGTVYAVDLADGAIAWTAETLGRVESPVAVADGAVYVVARNVDDRQAELVALDAAAHEELWTFEPATGVAASGVSASQEVVVVGASDRLVRGLSARTGEQRWTALSLTLFSPVSAPALLPDSLYIADASGGVYRIDPLDGSRAWAHQTNTLIVRGSPVVVGGAALVGLGDGRLVAFDVETGDIVYRSAASGGLVGAIAVGPDVVVAVKGGGEAGLIAFEHDPAGTLVRIESPTILDPVRLFGGFALAAIVVSAVILLTFGVLRSRIGPAFTREDEDEDEEGERST